jgi:anaerobic dimethyl sulfoxide reductase subunit B (iron-sulfur subunit)
LSRQEDGTVQLDADRCIGCRYCEMACPFGAPSFDRHAGVMTKCHLCQHRTTLGLGPACVVACPTQALGFLGDGEDHLEEDSFRRADEIPGFSDPAEAKPRLWVSEPGGKIRSEWYEELRSLMAGGKDDSHGS